VALLFATMIIPIIGLVGLAIDYGIWNEAYSSLSVAASAASLNAAKTAASALALADSNYATEGATAGKQWFLAELGQGSYAATTGTTPPTVTITTKSNYVTATVSFTSTVKSIFGKVFKRTTYPITVTAAATMSAGSYLEVVLMLDNSSSMGIGADTTAMTTMMKSSPCDASNEFTRTSSSSTYTQATPEAYSLYQYLWQGVKYDGAMATPVVSGSLTLNPATPTTSSPTVSYCSAAQVTSGLCKTAEQCPTNVNGYAAYAGPPCAFACHSDSSKPAGQGNDLWHTARVNGVTLRLDTLKVATNLVLTAMQTNNISAINNLSVGIYTFNTTLNPIYPGTSCTPQAFGCEAGSNWTTAISAVGSPPKAGSGVYTDTGIQPPVAATSGNNDNTEVEEAMSNLANNYVTAAGNGATAATPRKVLMLITDGYEDDPLGSGLNGLRQAMPASACTPFKNMGYTVYVVYTPYYPLMHTYYLANMVSTVESTGAGSITYNLQACASNANDFITATDQTSLNAALLAFLTDALDSPATFTQ
jgi:Flp pilus assembly protein TadG